MFLRRQIRGEIIPDHENNPNPENTQDLANNSNQEQIVVEGENNCDGHGSETNVHKQLVTPVRVKHIVWPKLTPKKGVKQTTKEKYAATKRRYRTLDCDVVFEEVPANRGGPLSRVQELPP